MRRVMTALFVAEITAAFETAMIYAALGRLIGTFGDPIAVGWLVTSYLLVGAGSAAVAGRLGDLFGRRRVMLILMIFGVVGSLMSAMSSSFALVLVGRGLQGLTGGVMPLCVGLARDNLPKERLSLGVGIIVAGASAGTAGGLLIGGMIVDRFDWHTMFYASAFLAALSYVLVRAFVPQSTPQPKQYPLDLLGGLMFVPAIACILLYVSNGKSWGWLGPLPLAILASGVVIGALWLRHSLRHPHPLIDPRLFSNRSIWVANLIAALVALGGQQITLVFAVLLQAPVWTGIGLGVTATMAALVKLPSNVFALGAGPLSGLLIPRLGGRTVMIIGGIICAGGWLLALFSHHSVTMVGITLCVIAFGTTIMYATTPNVIVAAAPAERTSEAVGMLMVIRQAFISIGAQLIAVVMAIETVKRPDLGPGSYPTSTAFLITVLAIVGLTIVATLVAFLLPGKAAEREAREADAATDAAAAT